MEKINFINNSEPYLSAETLNQMQSNIEEAIGEYYSTEETFTGKYWVDGERIYRKVLGLGALGQTEEIKTFTLSGDYKYVLDFRPYIILGSAVNLIPIHIDETTYIEAEVSSDGNGNITITVKRGSADAWFDWSFDCVIEYTKTIE